MQHVTKSRTTSAMHVEIGDRKNNLNRQLEVVPNNRNVQNALQERQGRETPSSGHIQGKSVGKEGRR